MSQLTANSDKLPGAFDSVSLEITQPEQANLKLLDKQAYERETWQKDFAANHPLSEMSISPLSCTTSRR